MLELWHVCKLLSVDKKAILYQWQSIGYSSYNSDCTKNHPLKSFLDKWVVRWRRSLKDAPQDLNSAFHWVFESQIIKKCLWHRTLNSYQPAPLPLSLSSKSPKWVWKGSGLLLPLNYYYYHHHPGSLFVESVWWVSQIKLNLGRNELHSLLHKP
jgi:hypothetical protein